MQTLHELFEAPPTAKNSFFFLDADYNWLLHGCIQSIRKEKKKKADGESDSETTQNCSKWSLLASPWPGVLGSPASREPSLLLVCVIEWLFAIHNGKLASQSAQLDSVQV